MGEPLWLGNKSKIFVLNTVNSEILARVLFLGNFVIAEFCENKTLVKREITLSIIDVGKSCPS